MSKSAGKVKFFNETKGFGFIVNNKTGKDVFVHVSGLNGGVKHLNKDEDVEFEEFEGKKGLQAKNVEIV